MNEKQNSFWAIQLPPPPLLSHTGRDVSLELLQQQSRNTDKIIFFLVELAMTYTCPGTFIYRTRYLRSYLSGLSPVRREW